MSVNQQQWRGAAYLGLQTALNSVSWQWVLEQTESIRTACADRELLALSVMKASSQRRRQLGEGVLSLTLPVSDSPWCEASGDRQVTLTVCDLAYGLWMDTALGKSDKPAALLEKLFAYGDDAEKAALMRSLYWLDGDEASATLASQVLRVNTVSLFSALAINNPLPARVLDEREFNQLVLKSLFLGVDVFGVMDLNTRRNADLARMADDYLHERRLAGRSIPDSLWRVLDTKEPSQATLAQWTVAMQEGSDEARFGVFRALAEAASEGRSIAPALLHTATNAANDVQHPTILSVVQEMHSVGIHRLT